MTNYVFGGGIERVVTYQFDNSLTHSKAPRSSAVSTESEQGFQSLRFYSSLRTQNCCLPHERDETVTNFSLLQQKAQTSASFVFSVSCDVNVLVVVEHV